MAKRAEQLAIEGTRPEDWDQDIDDAARQLAGLDEDIKALRKDRELAESILRTRMEEKGLAHYRGNGLAVDIDITQKAKVQVFDGRKGDE